MCAKFMWAGVVGALAAGAAAQPYVMVVESTNDKVMLFDTFDGSLVNAAFIDLTPQGASTPINAIQVGGEIWVSDQIVDSIFRYSLDGTTHLGTISGGMDNIRGMEYVASQGRVYISNAGTGNGAPGDAMLIMDVATQTIINSAIGPDPFDIIHHNGRLLVSDIDEDDIDIYDYDGVLLGEFHNSDGLNGIDFSEQFALSSNGGIFAAGFSSPIGLFEYDAFGNQINYWNVGGGNRGVFELGNGNLLFTDGDGVHVFDIGANSVTTVFSGVSGRFADILVPAPGALGLLGAAGALALRRRR